MSRLEQLKDCSNLHDIARLLGYEPKNLAYILYKIPDNQKYSTFKIPKKSGGIRTIKAPHSRLKAVQRRLCELLQDCTEELLPNEQRLTQDQEKQSPHRANKAISHGFKKGLSIASNAAKHKQKKYVFNIDIEDFFPSINFGRVRGYFIKNKNFQLNDKVATILAQIACHENSLPQGSPCSPIISNLIGEVLDIRLLKLAQKYKCTYSRYADDLTFSTNQKVFPKAIAFKKSHKKSDWLAGKQLHDCITRADFKINSTKTRMQYSDSRQVVTGLVVNKVVNTKSEYYRNARVMCNSLFMKGHFHLPKIKEIANKKKKNLITRAFISLKGLLKSKPNNTLKDDNDTPQLGSIKQLEGILSHIYYIKNYKNKYAQKGYRDTRHDGIRLSKKGNPDQDQDTIKYPPLNRCNQYADESHQVSVDGIKNLYSKFLFFKHFYFLDKPTIICEGKTDNIYFQCGLKNLISEYPQLILQNNAKKQKSDPDFLFNITFLNKTNLLHEMLKMAEGASGLKYLMLTYERRIKRYKCKGKLHPVIMIADNDEEGNKLVNAACEKYSKNKNDSFIHVIDNLYIIQIPKIKNKDTAPEDYFDKNTRQKPYKGRAFEHDPPTRDPNKKLSKASFAHDIVGRNWKSINFDSFKPVYNTIELIIDDYKTKLAAM